MENTSGLGDKSTIPAEIDKWNWGAFLLNWIWGIGNNTYIALLMFLPFVNLIMIFVLGAKGSAWAWRNKKWESIEQFKDVQRKWTKWALILFALSIVFSIGIFFAASAMMKNSEAFKMATAKLEASQEAATVIGKPISTGFPMGNFNVSGTSGKADISFSVTGSKSKGTVYIDAVKDMGKWEVSQLIFEEDDTGKRIDLNK